MLTDFSKDTQTLFLHKVRQANKTNRISKTREKKYNKLLNWEGDNYKNNNREGWGEIMLGV